jgi:aryl carrier-like protein
MEPDERVAALSPAKRELLEQWLAAENDEAAAGAERRASADYVAPRTDGEQILADIWQQQFEAGPVGIDDDYFELGGDSIHAILIVGRAQEAGVQLETPDLFAFPTIRQLAERSAAMGDGDGDGAGDGEDSAPVAARAGAASAETGPFPLTPLQQGMLYHSVGGSTPGAYVVQLRCDLTGDLDVAAFEAAWRAVFAANAALRAVIGWSSGDRPTQQFRSDLVLPFDVLDHSALSAAEQQAAFEDLLEADRGRGFDLQTGPLMRFTLVRAGSAAYRCVWTYHHLVLDGWAQQLVLRDVFDCYQRLRAGSPAEPRVRPAFTDYLAWLAEQTETPDEYWRDRFAGVTSGTRVAGPGCADGRVVTAARPVVEVPLEPAAAARLTAFTREHGLTVSTLVHGGWALLLSEHCDQEDVLFGSTMSGRPPELPGATECVGMFVSTLPLRVRYQPDVPALEWLAGVQRDLVELRGHQHEGLSRVERAAGLGFGAGLFDNILVVENFPAWIGDGDVVAGLRVDGLSVVVEEGYPLVLEYAPGAAPVLRARYDDGRMSAAQVGSAAGALLSWLELVTAEADTRLGELRERVAGVWHAQRDEGRRERRGLALNRLDGARRRPLSEAREEG